MSLSLKKVEGNRNFANKIWNAGRFVISAINRLPSSSGSPAADDDIPNGETPSDWTLADCWIWARLQQLVREVERLFQTYQYGEAGRQIYEFFWNDFADWYVEVAKLQLAAGDNRALHTTQLLSHVPRYFPAIAAPHHALRDRGIMGSPAAAPCWHPRWLAWQKSGPKALIIAPWPEQRQSQGWEEARLADFALVQDTVRAIRNLRAEKKVSPAKRIPATIAGGAVTALVNEQAEVIAALAGVDRSRLEIHATLPAKPENSFALVVGPVEIYIPLSGMLDLDEERNRIQKELDEIRAQIDRLENLLGSDFASKAPARVVEKERQRLEEFQQTAAKLKAQLEP